MAPRPSSPPVRQCPEGRHTGDTLHPKPGSSETRLASGTTQTQSLSSSLPWRLRSLPYAHGEPPEVTMANSGSMKARTVRQEDAADMSWEFGVVLIS